MRVLQIMAGAEKGGAETFFVDLVCALHKTGLEQRVIIRNNKARAAELRAVGLDPIELPFGQWFDFKTKAAIAKEIATFKPDIVQTWMNRATSACPTGSFVHIGWLGGYYDVKYFKACQELVGVTQGIVDHLIESGWPKEHAHYLPTLSANDPMPAIPRSEFDTPDDVPLIMALGRLHQKKGFDILLSALAQVPEAYLWLAGEGPLREQLEAQTKQLGLEQRVRFLGWRTDRAALFESCDFCVMPSRYEPFGTVMIEAWAYKRPIIAAASKGPVGLIKNRENGLLVPIDDVQALVSAMQELINDKALAAQMVNTAYATYESTYTEAKVAEQHINFYRSLLSHKKAAA